MVANLSEVGGVEDVILSVDGQMLGLTTDVGGFIGIGDKTVMILLEDIRLVRPADGSDMTIVTRLGLEALEDLPEFEIEDWSAHEARRSSKPTAGSKIERRAVRPGSRCACRTSAHWTVEAGVQRMRCAPPRNSRCCMRSISPDPAPHRGRDQPEKLISGAALCSGQARRCPGPVFPLKRVERNRRVQQDLKQRVIL